jgi:hypothetical protein
MHLTSQVKTPLTISAQRSGRDNFPMGQMASRSCVFKSDGRPAIWSCRMQTALVASAGLSHSPLRTCASGLCEARLRWSIGARSGLCGARLRLGTGAKSGLCEARLSGTGVVSIRHNVESMRREDGTNQGRGQHEPGNSTGTTIDGHGADQGQRRYEPVTETHPTRANQSAECRKPVSQSQRLRRHQPGTESL